MSTYYNPFILPSNEYKRHLDLLGNLIQMYKTYLKINHNLVGEEAKLVIRSVMKDHGFRDPEIEYYERKENKDKVKKKGGFLGYLKEVASEGNTLAPSMTVYISPDKEEGIDATYTFKNVNVRNDAKQNAKKFYAEKKMELYEFYNGYQNSKKILNNSLSGAYASVFNVLYSPSAHYGLTSVTRCVAGIGNALTELMVANNYIFKTPHLIMDYITSIVTFVDIDKVKNIVTNLKLRIPTAKETVKVLLKSGHMYWKDLKMDREIFNYVKKLDGYQRAAVVYVNNFHNIRKFNDNFLKELVTDMIEIETGLVNGREEQIKLLKSMPEFIINLLMHILSEEVKGKDVKFDKIEDSLLLDQLASTAYNIYHKIERQESLIDTFFRTNILPPNVADTKMMIRDAIVLSDTDSTCGSYQDWVEWFFGKIAFHRKATAVSAIIMTFVTQAIDHNLKVLATNMNVKPDKRDLLKMKNEYYWPLMAIYASKNYYAKVNIKEGFVFDSYKPEIKGPTLLGGAFPEAIKNGQKELIKHILTTVEKKGELDLQDVLKRVKDMEEYLIERINKADYNFLRVSSIKPSKAYSEGEKNSTYFQYLLWNEVFKDMYGAAPTPEYKVVTVPVETFSNASINRYIEEGKGDLQFLEKVRAALKKFNKKDIKQFRVPLGYAESIGVPKELKPFIDYQTLLKTTMAGYYMILETLGVYRHNESSITEMFKK